MNWEFLVVLCESDVWLMKQYVFFSFLLKLKDSSTCQLSVCQESTAFVPAHFQLKYWI